MSCFPLWCTKQIVDSFHVSQEKSIFTKELDGITDIEKQFAWFYSLPLVNNLFDDLVLKGGEK